MIVEEEQPGAREVGGLPQAPPRVPSGRDEEAETEDGARRVAGNSFWLIVQPLLLNVLSVGSNFYIARELGVADYGAFNIGFAQAALFAPLCNLGMYPVTIRAIAENRANARAIARAAYTLWLLSVALAVVLALGWLALPAYSGKIRLIGLAAVFCMAVNNSSAIAAAVSLGFERSGLAARPRMIAGVILTVLSVLALALGLGLPGFIAAYVIGAVLQFTLLMGTVRRHFFPIVPAWDPARIRKLLEQIRPFAALSLLYGFGSSFILDLLILGMLFKSSTVGPYAAAMGLIARLLAVPEGIGAALFPFVASRYEETRAEVESTVRRYVLNQAVVTAPLSLCLCFTAPTVLWLLFGEPFVAGAGILRLLAWTLVLNGGINLTRECLCAVHQQGTVVRLSVLSISLLAVCYLAFIPLFHMTGAALTGLVQASLMLAAYGWIFSRWFRRPVPLPEMGRLVLALGAMSIVYLPLLFHYHHIYALVSVPISFLIYAGALLALKLVDGRALLAFVRSKTSLGA